MVAKSSNDRIVAHSCRLARRVSVVLCLSLAVAACADDESDNAPGTPPTTIEPLAPNGTEIDRSAVPPGAAPGDGSGQGKTPEGNTNSGDTPASSTR
jgi:hypothetical protein